MTFLNSIAEEETEQIVTYPSCQLSLPSAATYVSPEELSSLLNESQRIEDLFSRFTVDEPVLCSEAPSMDINDLLAPLIDSVDDDDIFHDMMDAYTTL